MAKDPQRQMTTKAAARIQSNGDRHSKSETAKSGFAARAQRAAANKGTSQRKS